MSVIKPMSVINLHDIRFLTIAWMWCAVLAGSAPYAGTATAQSERTVGVIHSEAGTFDGYTFFAPRSSYQTFLVDMEGRLVHTWRSDYLIANPAYMLDDGSILRTATFGRGFSRFDAGGVGGRVERIDWEGNLIWAYELAGDEAQLHHDIELLPNGNVLMMAWVYKTREEAIEAGRDSLQITEDGVWPETIIEVRPTGAFGGEIVWQWNVWDHMIQDFDPTRANYGDVAAHPELIDVNFQAPRGEDWIHFNSVAYHPELDQIVLSNRGFSEVWIVDHSTSTQEAAGHTGGRYGRGGDLLYRWGNPAAYRAGTDTDQVLFGQHHVHWVGPDLVGEDRLLIFNNGFQRPAGAFSSVEELEPPTNPDGSYVWPAPSEAFGPAAPVWTYTAPVLIDLYAAILSGAERLPNGNTFVTDGAHGTAFEITPGGDEVWRYVSPVVSDTVVVPQYGEIPDEGFNRDANTIFRFYRFGADHAGLAGRDLTPGLTLEDGALTTAVDETPDDMPRSLSVDAVYPNPFQSTTTITFSSRHAERVRLYVTDVLGRVVRTLVDGITPAGQHRLTWDGTDGEGRPLASGLYVCTVESGSDRISRAVTLVR
jgi:hypothetical protein